MAKIKKHDFIEIEYTGRLKEDGMVFDTTGEKVSKENNIYNQAFKYGPVIICVGEEQLIKALDEGLIGKESQGQYVIEAKPENGFGKKDPKLLRMIPLRTFREQNIQPMPGLQVNIDGVFGTVASLTPGRVIVDFNHPLAGKELVYDIKVNRIVEDDKEKLTSYLSRQLGKDSLQVELDQNTARVKMDEEIPNDIHKKIEEKVKEIIPSIDKLEFVK